MTGTVDVALDARAYLGESPVWDAAGGRLLWVDILAGRIHALDPNSGVRSHFDVGQAVGAVAPRDRGGLVLAMENGFAVLDANWANLEQVAVVQRGPRPTRFNDGKCDPAGRFWAGTVAYDETPGSGGLYRLSSDGVLDQLLTNVTVSNGLAWSNDNTTMYYVDSPTGGVDTFDFDPATGSLTKRRRLVTVDGRDGVPDGITVDTDGCLWVALWGGGAVHRYSPEGRLDRRVEVPVSNVTSCAFGGWCLETLFITSAREGLSAKNLAAEPLAGAIFAFVPGVRGWLPDRFAG